MGRQFVANYGGLGLLYSCKICDTYLTSHGELSSPNFTGGTGPAMLFRKVWNIEHGSPVGRKMTTGYHIVRDVSCLVCKNRVGWMYEMAYEPSQEYKEGQVILECELICRQNAIEDPLGADRIDIVEKKPHIHFERPSGRRRQRGRNSRSGSDESFSSDSSNSRSNNSSFSS